MVGLSILLAILAAVCLEMFADVLAARRTDAAPAPPRRTSFWRRRAVWVNVATVAAAGLAVVEASVGEWKEALAPWGYTLIGVAMAMAAAGLRLIHNKDSIPPGE